MEPSRDNPFIRFSAFWWGMLSMLLFALILAVALLVFRGEPTDLEDFAAEGRYETLANVNEAQAASLALDAVNAAIPAVAASLASSTPVAVEVPAQVVPGSATALALAESAVEADLSDFDEGGEADTPIDPEVMTKGQTAYLVCAACHGQEGEGGPAGPPLAGSEWVTGPISNLIRIQLRGLQGPIVVKGEEYNMVMAPMAFQTDDQIAAVLTYIRNSFGNEASAVTPDQVEALRGEVGLPMLTVEDLIQP